MKQMKSDKQTLVRLKETFLNQDVQRKIQRTGCIQRGKISPLQIQITAYQATGPITRYMSRRPEDNIDPPAPPVCFALSFKKKSS
jgi:hypothetical protein